MTLETVGVNVASEIARRAERANADARLCRHDNIVGPGPSAAARREAHIGDLALVNGVPEADLYAALHAGQLIETVGGEASAMIRVCILCGRRGPAVQARHRPQQTEVSPVCRNEDECCRV